MEKKDSEHPKNGCWHQPYSPGREEGGLMRQSGSPMQLTRAADYGIRAMIHLASLPEGTRAPLPDISLATNVPPAFLSKVLQALTHSHMVASSRGASGGFHALASGRKASLRQLIEAIDGPISLNACVLAGDNCQREGPLSRTPSMAARAASHVGSTPRHQRR